MKVVVIGGTGLIGSKLIPKLEARGIEAVAAAPNTGVNTLTGEGLADVLAGANTVVDVSNSPSFDDAPAMDFFTKSTGNLLSYEGEAGVKHHVALSVVGTDRLGESGYFRAKMAQEKMIEDSHIPYSIVHATQFFEFVKSIVEEATEGNEVHVPPALIQPMAADDVASAVGSVAAGAPLNKMVEFGGPKAFQFDELVGEYLEAAHDSRKVVTDPDARYYGIRVNERMLVPGNDARHSETTFEHWLGEHPAGAAERR